MNPPNKRKPPPTPIVIYPIKKSGGSKWDNNELRFSLRSVEKYFRLVTGRPPKVFILTTAKIPFLNHENLTVLKVAGYAEAVLAAVQLARKYSPTGHYVWMNDDICFLKPILAHQLYPAINIGKMKAGQGESRKDVGGWRFKLIKIRDHVASMGMKPLNYSAHSPYLFQADKMEITLATFGLVYKTPVETAYFNLWRDEIPTVKDKSRIIKHNPPEELPWNLQGKKFLNYSDAGLNLFMKGFLHGKFPNPSIYEKL